MAIFSIQYLESSPTIAQITPDAARSRLQAALDRLPISLVLLGWDLPESLFHVCADVCEQAGARLYRWQPLLTGDGTFIPRPEWQVINLNGDPIPGFQHMPEFTFVCPNRPAVREAVLAHAHDLLNTDRYQGVFLDRIRYPSPASGPEALGCFCEDCQRAAAQEGLDLNKIRCDIARLIATPGGAAAFVRTLLDPHRSTTPDPGVEMLGVFLGFRARSITRFIHDVAGLVHESGRAVGLDGFSPALAYMVGQDLRELDRCADWTKIMSYGHTLGPAGMPFELLGLADWLIEKHGVSEAHALALLSDAAKLALPSNRAGLRQHGLSSDALKSEARRARQSGIKALLTGIELVDLKGITDLNAAQIRADVTAFHAAGVDGLALSWDLWLIPLDRLTLIHETWGTAGEDPA